MPIIRLVLSNSMLRIKGLCIDIEWKLQLKELCHHYNKMSGAAKVEAHVLATVVAHCLMYPAKNYQQTMGDLAAKV